MENGWNKDVINSFLCGLNLQIIMQIEHEMCTFFAQQQHTVLHNNKVKIMKQINYIYNECVAI